MVINIRGCFMKESVLNERKIEFLNLAYNRFYDIYEEVIDDNFWTKESYYRFSKVKDAFSIYSELLNYEPLKDVIKYVKEKRPPMEGDIASNLFKFIRNIFSHFPFFESWDSVYINKNLINWHKEGQSIDRFLKKYSGINEVKYRYWEYKNKKMTYLTISFPEKYDNKKIYLKDILSEKEGVIFSLILMKKILETQVLEIKE